MHVFFQRGGWWVLGQATLLILLVSCGLAWRHQWESRIPSIGGVVLLTVGVFFGIAGAFSLGRNLTAFPIPSANARLIQSGIYGLVRHPLYTAVICAAFGFSLLMKSWSALACAVGLAIFLNQKARKEEDALRRQFPNYASYEKRVRRFIPWVY